MAQRPIFSIALQPTYVPFSVNVAIPSDPSVNNLVFLLGVLNSRLAWSWFAQNAKWRGAGIEINGNVLENYPLPPLASSREGVINRVHSMLSLHEKLPAEKLPQKREQIQREIDATDRQIDQLVYQLYGLTDEEIKIVEEATA